MGRVLALKEIQHGVTVVELGFKHFAVMWSLVLATALGSVVAF
jgi:hypothetical protein